MEYYIPASINCVFCTNISFRQLKNIQLTVFLCYFKFNRATSCKNENKMKFKRINMLRQQHNAPYFKFNQSTIINFEDKTQFFMFGYSRF